MREKGALEGNGLAAGARQYLFLAANWRHNLENQPRYTSVLTYIASN